MERQYGHRSLAQKLGIRDNLRGSVIDPPAGYKQEAELPASFSPFNPDERYDFLQIFVSDLTVLKEHLPRLASALLPAGALWLSWPKASASRPADLHENALRELGLAAGLVDIKVISINENWSGLKFVYRLRDRH